MQGFDLEVIVASLPFLMEGMKVTILLTVLGVMVGLPLGVLLAVARMTLPAPVPQIVFSYVNLCRSVPLLLVVFWFYFMVPMLIGRPVGGYYSVQIAIILFEAAIFSEIVRAGIQSVGKGQLQAAHASGLSTWQAYRHVILPQSLRRMVPILITQTIILFQDTSLVYVVGVRDFLTTATIVAERESRVVELYVFVAVVYFLICVAGSRVVERLGNKAS
ncbi:amino acid ABC transporter permease [Parapusillimonas sp. SGNA-6]|nr:amino acid ABC transporter permease [Parapusillimonas sp. SGNA-6]